jgi:hypothetical protein
MGNKYTLINDESGEIEDRGFKSKQYFIDHSYSRLVGTGTTYREALDNLTRKCKYNGVYAPKKHPTLNEWHCGVHNETSRGKKYKKYHPVFFYTKADTKVAYTYYYPV